MNDSPTNYVTTITEERVREIVREEIEAALREKLHIPMTPNMMRERLRVVEQQSAAPGSLVIKREGER